ncbi:aldehyde dehydrogenase [candidate division TA06 bacterium DG_26]|uniref:Aldehyde dehydrogenase n=1 Tax=candidate division TA06 bacterium DG_26 TaxID=1703771 RepID=A0A0S7WGM4_UNCT6|nr:MAG: aldehyde dehydrogenase [candidate division TA06 bacterium DG_26]
MSCSRKMFIDGKWVDKEDMIDVTNPYDGSFVDRVPSGTSDDVEKAVQSCKVGVKEAKKLSAWDRYKILRATSELIEQRGEELATLLAKEVGKTIKEARGEVSRAAETFLLSAEEAKRIHGEMVPFDAAPGAQTKFGFYMRVPLGVVAAITPFNFPLNLAAHKIAPAIAAGNTVILKPATKTPLADLVMVELLLEAGLPAHMINAVTGPGNAIGDAIVSHEAVRMVTFTGSLEVGTRIAHKAGLKRIVLELGSNSACVVAEDGDLQRAAERIRVGAFAVAGQVCISVQRVFVQSSVFDAFLGILTDKVKRMRVGDQLKEETDMGPMISVQAAEKTSEWIEEAVAKGARLHVGGEKNGSLFQPTLLTHVPRECSLFTEEAFAPLAIINPYDTIEEAIDLVNDSKYGLQAGIFTRDMNRALYAAREFENGGVMINEVPTFRVDLMPYGGQKRSGIGREGPKYAVDEMTEMRVVGIELS